MAIPDVRGSGPDQKELVGYNRKLIMARVKYDTYDIGMHIYGATGLWCYTMRGSTAIVWTTSAARYSLTIPTVSIA